MTLLNDKREVILQCRVREDEQSHCYHDPNHFVYDDSKCYQDNGVDYNTKQVIKFKAKSIKVIKDYEILKVQLKIIKS